MLDTCCFFYNSFKNIIYIDEIFKKKIGRNTIR